MKNHKTGRPFVMQYPRLTNPGWDGKKDLRSQIHSASFHFSEAEFNAVGEYDPIEIFDQLQTALAMANEAVGMLVDRYGINVDERKQVFVKKNADMFCDALNFLEPVSDDE